MASSLHCWDPWPSEIASPRSPELLRPLLLPPSLNASSMVLPSELSLRNYAAPLLNKSADWKENVWEPRMTNYSGPWDTSNQINCRGMDTKLVIPVIEPSSQNRHLISDQSEPCYATHKTGKYVVDVHHASAKEKNIVWKEKLLAETLPDTGYSWPTPRSGNILGTWDGSADPTIEECIFTLQAWIEEKKLEPPQRVHEELCLMGLESHVDIGNQLVVNFVDCGSLSFAEQIIERLTLRNEKTWAYIISGYAQVGDFRYAFYLYRQMLNDNVSPSSYTYMVLLRACACIQNLEMGQQLHAEIVQRAFEKEIFVGNTVVYMYAKCNLLSDAWVAFQMLPIRNVVCWTTIISGYAENGHHQKVPDLFQQMEHDHVIPNAWTLACLLRVCGVVCNTDTGWKTHSEVILRGFEKDPYVGNALVYMYTNIGLLPEAEMVFNNLSVLDSVAWNVLIGGYSNCGLHQEVLNSFNRMHSHAITPTAATFAYVVKACSSLGLVERGFEAHKGIIHIGAERDPSIANSLVGLYAGNGLLSEAETIFNHLPGQNIITFTALISGYAEHGYPEKAMEYVESMQQEGLSQDAVSFSCCLKACSNIEKLQKLHKIIVETGFEMDLSVGTALIEMYTCLGFLEEALEVFKQLRVQDVVSWTALIAGFAEEGRVEEGLHFLDEMQVAGIIPDCFVYNSLLKSCGNSLAMCEGRQLHREIILKGYESDDTINNSLISMYAKWGTLTDAQHIFDKLPNRDNVSWTSLIAGYAELGYCEEALNCMQLMQLEYVTIDSVTLSIFLKACGSITAVKEGMHFHLQAIVRGVDNDPIIGNTLVAMYSKFGLLVEAQEIFNDLLVKDTVSWNALISGYVEYSSIEALTCLQHMHDEKICPDSVTLMLTLKVCGKIGAIDHGRGIHSYIIYIGLQELSLFNCLINMYVECSSISEAQHVFDSLHVRDVATWSSIIKGYGMYHNGLMAMKLFEDMQRNGVMPHAPLFSCLLTACSHSSLTWKGQEYFKMMRENFSILPTEEHYSCMIDLLARSGHLYEAERFIEAFCPSAEGAWAALLTACKAFEEEYLGLRCFEQLVQLSPGEATWYMLMGGTSSLSSGSNFTDMLEELRKHAGILKKPASAFIEVNQRMHEFKPGVAGRNWNNDISIAMQTMNYWLKNAGHVPKLNSILSPIPDEHKEALLCEHAEKLAIAFGLLNTSQGQTIRVTKNLRMCNDCHDAGKIISKVERREIIIKDTSCIHHFMGGSCSCGDMY